VKVRLAVVELMMMTMMMMGWRLLSGVYSTHCQIDSHGVFGKAYGVMRPSRLVSVVVFGATKVTHKTESPASHASPNTDHGHLNLNPDNDCALFISALLYCLKASIAF
jgi:hypothetical protein